VPSKKLAELVLERHDAMMLFWVRQVRLYLIDVRIADGKGAVTILPLKIWQPQFIVDPTGRVCFDQSDGIGDRDSSSER
jgi:hypothetical protein